MKRGRWKISLWPLVMALVLTLALAGCTGAAPAAEGGEKAIRIGSKGFTENLIVAELYALALEDSGYAVKRVFDVASAIDHVAITSDEIDLYPEYTGTGLIVILGQKPVTDPDEVLRILQKEYEAQFDLVWLSPAEANDGQGIVMRTDTAQRLGISTLSDLQAKAGEVRFASQGEFEVREDGLPALEAVYGPFDFASINVFSNSLKYDVLENDEADAAPAYTTEGQLSQPQFTLLEDDQKAWPPYNIAPVMRGDYYRQNPAAVKVIEAVSATLDTPTITGLNAEVDVDGKEFEDVAAGYYETIRAGVQAAAAG